nr:regulatory protein GemA [Brucella anthropi]
MSMAIAKINIGKQQLGLDEDTYRELLFRVTGKVSLRAMSSDEHQLVLDDLQTKGFKPTSKGASKGRKKRLEGRYAAKMQALWIAGYNLGVVTNNADEALIAFVHRQTGLDHIRFLHDPADANKAIETLKKWLEREAGIDWKKDSFLPSWANEPHGQIVTAQWRILTSKGLTPRASMAAEIWSITRRKGKPQPNELTKAEWQMVMNSLGRRVRKALG